MCILMKGKKRDINNYDYNFIKIKFVIKCEYNY